MNHKIFLFTVLSACAAEEPKKTILQAAPRPTVTPSAIVASGPVSQPGAALVMPQSSSLASVSGKTAESQALENIMGDRLGEVEGGAGISIKGTGVSKGSSAKQDPLNSAEATGDEATVSEGLDKDVVRRVIRRAIPGIKFCYEQALQSKPTLKGKVVVDFTIASNGAVTDSKASKGIDPDVDACVAKKLSNLSFPTPTDGKTVTVSYPFTFSTAE